jgi:hypothetical protein
MQVPMYCNTSKLYVILSEVLNKRFTRDDGIKCPDFFAFRCAAASEAHTILPRFPKRCATGLHFTQEYDNSIYGASPSIWKEQLVRVNQAAHWHRNSWTRPIGPPPFFEQFHRLYATVLSILFHLTDEPCYITKSTLPRSPASQKPGCTTSEDLFSPLSILLPLPQLLTALIDILSATLAEINALM